MKTHPDAVTPLQGSSHAAGYDFFRMHSCIIPPHNIALIDTGISAQFPPNTYGRIAARSGLAVKHML